MSFSFAIVGFVSTFLSLLNPVHRKLFLYVPIGFYTCMELLQGVQYSHVNQCGQFANSVSTEIAYILVIVQPLMWNILYYIRAPLAEKNLFIVGSCMAVIWMVFSITARLIDGPRSMTDTHSYVPSSDDLLLANGCTLQASSSNHLYWKWVSTDLRGLDANWLMYLMIWFTPALLGASSRRNVSYTILAAAIAMGMTYNYGADIAEFSSLWCMYSIPMMMVGSIECLTNLKAKH